VQSRFYLLSTVLLFACSTDPESEPPECESLLTRDACESAEPFGPSSMGALLGGSCIWEVRVSAAVRSDGTCEFGEPTGRCIGDFVSEIGCAGFGYTCSPDGPDVKGAWSDDGGETLLVSANVCSHFEGATACAHPDVEERPECACLCDPGWPG